MLEGNRNSPILHVTLKNFNLYLRYSIVQKIQHPSCIYKCAAVRHVLLIYISSLRNRGLLQIQTSQSWGSERLWAQLCFIKGKDQTHPGSVLSQLFPCHSIKQSHQNLSSGHLKSKSLRTKPAGRRGRAPASLPMHSWNSWAFATTGWEKGTSACRQ